MVNRPALLVIPAQGPVVLTQTGDRHVSLRDSLACVSLHFALFLLAFVRAFGESSLEKVHGH